MADRVVKVYRSGGYDVPLDFESVTTTDPAGTALRQRIQISVRDITSGTPTDVGDAANNAVRVNVIAGSTSSPNVTITNWTFGGTITTTGAATPNVTITNWTFGGTITTTGASSPNVTVTQWTAPQTVSVSGTLAATLTSLTATPTLFLAVTHTDTRLAAGSAQIGTATATQGTTPWVITHSGSQSVTVTQVLVSATQGTSPWVVTFAAAQPVSLSQVVLSSNVAATTPTGPAVQVVRSLAELLVPIFQVVSTTAASATIIPGVAGKRIFVTGYHLIVAAATTVTWIDSGATPAGLTGPLSFAANSGAAPQGTLDSPLFAVVTPGNALKISATPSVGLGGVVTAYQF